MDREENSVSEELPFTDEDLKQLKEEWPDTLPYRCVNTPAMKALLARLEASESAKDKVHTCGNLNLPACEKCVAEAVWKKASGKGLRGTK